MELTDRLLDRYHMRKRGWQVLEFIAAARYARSLTPGALKDVREMRKAVKRSTKARSGQCLFSLVSAPTVSIVIPVFNQWHLTHQCLASLSECIARSQAAAEVIVVDDHSTDGTPEGLRQVVGVRVLTNPENIGFNRAATRGAREARGQYVVFLNNDAMVLPGWLDGLLAAMGHDRVGAAGSKLVFPSGRLQEAGCLVWNDGSSIMVGRWRSPAAAEYEFLRDVDYCSAASLMVRADSLREVGFLDERFSPAYFEDADLCFSLRARGERVVYAPASVVVHIEGQSHVGGSGPAATNARDTAHQLRSRRLFVQKWADALRDHVPPPPRPATHEIWGSRRQVLPRVLVCDQAVDGGAHPSSVQAQTALRGLTLTTSRITLFVTEEGSLQMTRSLQGAGVEVVCGAGRRFARFVRRRANFYDVVIVRSTTSFERWMPSVKRHLPGAVLALESHELDGARLAQSPDAKSFHRLLASLLSHSSSD